MSAPARFPICSSRVRHEEEGDCPWCGAPLLEGDTAFELPDFGAGYCSPACIRSAHTFTDQKRIVSEFHAEFP